MQLQQGRDEHEGDERDGPERQQPDGLLRVPVPGLALADREQQRDERDAQDGGPQQVAGPLGNVFAALLPG